MNVGFRIPVKLDSKLPERTFDLREYLNFVWRHWMLIVSVTALGFVVAVAYLARAIPLYTATTQVLLEQREKAPGLDAVNDGGRIDTYSYSYVENQLAILRSDSLLRRVVIKEQLAEPNTKEAQASAQNKDDSASAERAILDGINRLRGALAISRSGHGLTRSGPTVALNDQQLADLNSKLIAARTEAAEKKARINFLADLAAGKKTLDSLPDSLQSASSMMAALRGKLADASQ